MDASFLGEPEATSANRNESQSDAKAQRLKKDDAHFRQFG